MRNENNPLKATLSNSDDFFNNGEIAKALLNSGQRDLLLLSNEDGNPEYFFGMYQTFSQMLLENRGIIFKREAYRSFKELPASIKNATQAVEEKETPIIDVKVYCKEDKIFIEVSDNGKGIKEEVEHLIFEPKFTTKTSGMGLGLPMIKNIIEAYDGSINFSSKEGQGTVFTVILPKNIN